MSTQIIWVTILDWDICNHQSPGHTCISFIKFDGYWKPAHNDDTQWQVQNCQCHMCPEVGGAVKSMKHSGWSLINNTWNGKCLIRVHIHMSECFFFIHYVTEKCNFTLTFLHVILLMIFSLVHSSQHTPWALSFLCVTYNIFCNLHFFFLHFSEIRSCEWSLMAGMPLLVQWTDQNDKKGTIKYEILV